MKQMKLFTARQMQEADRRAPLVGVPLWDLMRRAGNAVAAEAVRCYPQVQHWHVLAGPGNNGGDGWVAALGLLKRGRPATVWELAPGSGRSAEAARARQGYLRSGGHSRNLAADGLAGLREAVQETGGIIDALFGNGLNRPADDTLASLIGLVNQSGLPVVSIDLPSGLEPDLASSHGPHVMASLTVALAGLKPVHVLEPARSACGRIKLVDIGFPHGLLADCSDTLLLQPGYAGTHLPTLDPAGHKYTAGAVCVVAGSARYRGAAELSARAAWRGGAGLVTLVSDGQAPGSWPETIFESHDWQREWPPADLEHKRAAACLIGPGLAPEALKWLPRILDWAPGPVVLDAAALDPELLQEAGARLKQVPAVLTPHVGEAARLVDLFLPNGALSVSVDPLLAAELLAAHLGAVLVLKGPSTVIAGPSGELAVWSGGHPAMATGGSGDVLAGVISAALAGPTTGTTLFQRTCAAVVLHGVAGELAAERTGAGLTASDLIRSLPAARLHCTARAVSPC